MNAEPRDLDEFEYWLNCWGGEPSRSDHNRAFVEGYEQAMRDAHEAFGRVYEAPYGQSWNDYQRRSQRVPATKP